MSEESHILIIGVLWVMFWVYWLYPRRGTKRTVRTPTWRYGILMWAAYVIVIILVFQLPGARGLFTSYGISNPAISNSLLGYLGIPLCLLGMAFAIWARVHLGKNWGQPMSVKEKQELITSGPYAMVRHPMYASMGLALLGTMFFLGGLWFFVAYFFFCVFVVFSANREERLLTKEFPNEYPEYKLRTKAFIPFVW